MRNFLLLFSLLWFSCIVKGQTNDCVGAITVCGNGDLNLLPSGSGIDDFADPDNIAPSCAFTESKSLWLFIKIKEAGSLGFVITPDNNDCPNGTLCDDYDFAVYGPNATCGNLGASIRCQSTHPPTAGVGGETGMTEGGTGTSGGPSGAGNGFVHWLDNVNVGETYYILIDNFDERAGFSLTWSGTALLEDRITKAEGGVDLGNDVDECANIPVTLTATQPDGGTYLWQDGSTGDTFEVPAGASGTYSVEVVNSSGCRSMDEIDVNFSDLPATFDTSDGKCEATPGSGTATFTLNTYDAIVAPGATNATITYHASLANADNDTAPLVNNFSTSSTTIFARIEDNLTGCYNTTEVELTVFSQPIANTLAPWLICDNNNDATHTFDLTSQNATVLGDQSAASFTITYHTSPGDATTGASPILNPTALDNTSNPQTLHVRIENNVNPICFDVTTLELEVFDSPTANTVTDWPICDDNNDGQWTFDLSTKDIEILGAQPSATYVVTYHTNQNDADMGNAALPVTYTNATPTETIFVRIANRNNGDCAETTTFNLIVNNTPEVNNSSLPIVTCSPLQTANFDLTLADANVSGGATGVTVTYYLTPALAEDGLLPLPSPHTSISTTIFTRVTDNTTMCYDTGALDLVVNQEPAVIPQTLNVCSDVATASFDIASLEETIIDGAVNVTVTFHVNMAQADAGTMPLTSAYNSDSKIIYARSLADYEGNTCYSLSPITLTVDPNPEANDAEVLSCSETEVANFNLESAVSNITGGATNREVSFYETLDDAMDNVLPLASPHASVATNIFARVLNTNTQCVSIADITLTVQDNPDFEPEISLRECFINGIATFNLLAELNRLETLRSDLDFSFHTTSADANDNINPLANNIESLDVTIFTRIQFRSTDCYIVKPATLETIPTPVEEVVAVFCKGDGYTLPSGIFTDEPGIYEEDLQDPITGCDYTIITDLRLGEIEFVSAFSPNGNGANDRFGALPGEECVGFVNEYKLVVWNRWGEKVFETNDFTEGWDGRFNGSTAQASIYLWYAEYTFQGENFKREGTVALLK